jgi:hypothetical protein
MMVMACFLLVKTTGKRLWRFRYQQSVSDSKAGLNHLPPCALSCAQNTRLSLTLVYTHSRYVGKYQGNTRLNFLNRGHQLGFRLKVKASH